MQYWISVNKHLLKALMEEGDWAILFGAESRVRKNLDIIRKGTTLDRIKRAAGGL